MELTVETPNGRAVKLRLPPDFIVSYRSRKRATRALLAPVPDVFEAPETPGYVWRVEALPDGSLRFVSEALEVEPQGRARATASRRHR